MRRCERDLSVHPDFEIVASVLVCRIRVSSVEFGKEVTAILMYLN